MWWLSFLFEEKEETKKMKFQKFYWVLVIGFIGFFFPCSVSADEYSLTMVVRAGEQMLSDMNVSIYKVGDMDESGRLYFIGEFIERTEDLNGLTASESKVLASKLISFIQERQIVALSQQNSDVNGEASFLRLDQGIYLLDVESVTQDQIRYDTSPTLIVIPIAGQTEDFHFYIQSKTEAVHLDDNENGSTVDSPSTYDSIWFYVILAIISFLGMIAFIIYFLVRKKRKIR